MRAGFNVWDNKFDLYRTYFGHSEDIEIKLVENASGKDSGESVIWLLPTVASLLSVLAL